MTEQFESLFVYGTLKPVCSNFCWIETHVHATKPGWIRGILVDLGNFPALVQGDGIVEGVLLRIDTRGFGIADKIEGFSLMPRRNLYVRSPVIFVGDDGLQEPAWAYYCADPQQIVNQPTLRLTETGGRTVYSWPVK